MKREKRAGWALLLLLGTAAAAALLLILLERATTFTSDDYYYAMFWRDGIRQFIRKTGGHFLSRNGRVIVHVLASTFGAMDLTLFAVFCTAMLGAVFALLFHYQQDGASVPRGRWAVACAGFFLCLLAADYRVMKSWFLCVADAFNYIYPLLMAGILLFFLDEPPKALNCGTPGRRRLWRALLLLSALLAGATTEQGGSIAVGLIILTILRQGAVEKRVDRWKLWALCAALLGLVTIFLSPATRQRAAAEFSIPLLMNSFLQYANSLAAPGLSLRVMVLLSFVMGLLPLTRRAPKLLFAGLPLGVVLAAGWFRPLNVEWNRNVCALFFCYLLVSAAVLIFRSPYCRSGFLLLAGLATAGVVMLSRSCSVRVTTPLVLLMILCAVFFFSELYACLIGEERLAPAALGLAAVFAAVVVLQIPTFRGVWSNHAILKENEQAVERARVSGVLEYQDYDPNYCLQDLFSNWLVSSFYLSYYQLPGETEVVQTYVPSGTIPLNGNEEPVIIHNGMTCIPLEMLTYHDGGSFEVITDSFLRIRVDGRTILYHTPAFYTEDGVVDANGQVFLCNDYYYINTELAGELGLLR